MVLMEQGESHRVGSKILQVWDIQDHPILWSKADPPNYQAFRRRVIALMKNADPVHLLRANPSRNNDLVADNAKLWVKPATCLQKLLHQVQHERLDTLETPTEYAAVLLHQSPQRLRIYYYSNNQNGIGRMNAITQPVAQAHQDGWRVIAGLHNHNFRPDDAQLNGAVAPSLPDAQFNIRFAAQVGMAQAWITNGLDTAEIPGSAFHLFEQPH